MASSLLSVETVTHRTQMRRFSDVPFLLFGSDPRWSRPVRAYDQWRLDERRHPFFDTGSAAYFLARLGGHPAGRITAQVARTGDTEATFGFLAAPDDEAVTGALLDAAAKWLTEQGVESMVGPVSWTEDEEFGVPVAGTEHVGLTGRPWHPGYYAEHFVAAGLEPGEKRHTYRLATANRAGDSGDTVSGTVWPAQAGAFGDDRIVLDDIAAVPDVSGVLGDVSVRSAWRRARQAAQHQFTTAVCVRCTGDPEVLVPQLIEAAGAAGYKEVITPWAPPGTEPETTHQVFSRRWS